MCPAHVRSFLINKILLFGSDATDAMTYMDAK